MPSLKWYLQRLTAMPPAEVPWRTWRLLRGRAGRYRHWPIACHVPLRAVWDGPCTAERMRSLANAFPPTPDDATVQPWPTEWRHALLAEAEDLLAHRMSFFALNRESLGQQIDWNRDYASGKTVPITYAPDLDYRDPEQVGDVKYVWELGRMQHLVRMAQAWRLSHDVRFAKEIVDQITTWIDQCPYMMGIHWTSPMESALRLISWTWACHLIRDGLGLTDNFCQLLVRSVHQHLTFIDGNYSRYSSANNHLIAEASGAYFAATYWRQLDSSHTWRQRARTQLIAECTRQNWPDGVNKEQAFGYQFFVWDLLLVPALMGRENGDDFPSTYWERLQRMADFMAWVSDGNGNTPNVGDEDGGMAVDLGGDRRRPVIAMCNTAAALWGASGGEADEKTAWMLGEGPREIHELDTQHGGSGGIPSAINKNSLNDGGSGGIPSAINENSLNDGGSGGIPPVINEKTLNDGGSGGIPPVINENRLHASTCPNSGFPTGYRMFPEGGYAVFREGTGVHDEVMLVFDVGPLGWPATAAHGHADALSLWLHLAGQPFLVDAGTLSYQDTVDRRLFRSTSRHNTACFGIASQSQYLNRFLWGKRAKTTFTEEALNNRGTVVDGQVLWWTGQSHERRVRWETGRQRCDVQDAWEADVAPTIHFWIAADVHANVADGTCVVTGRDATLRISASDARLVLEEEVISTRPYCKEITQKICVRPSGKKGSTDIEMTWEFAEFTT